MSDMISEGSASTIPANAAFQYDTDLGPLWIAAHHEEITQVAMGGPTPAEHEIVETQATARAAQQIGEYLAGERETFELAIRPAGTAFQQAVWLALQAIPYGETRSYREVAAAIGKPSACRAVGMANHRNPIAIVVPCHRVIGADGSLTGYAGGLDVKRRLLELERASSRPSCTATEH